MDKLPKLNVRQSTRALAGVGVVLAALVTAGCSEGVNHTERNVTICGKERVVDSNGDSAYRVYTSDGSESHTYTVVDTLIVGGYRQDSADFYGALREDVTYHVESSGYRQGLLDRFPNMIEVQRLAEDQQHPEWCA